MIRLYKLLSIPVSLLGGMLAGAIFRKIWKVTARDEQTPKATDAQRGWTEVLVAAALQGVIVAVIKAALDRGFATGTHKLTGVWPGENGHAVDKAA